VDKVNNDNAEIEIITLNGQVVYNTSTTSKSTIINLKHHIENGVLLVRVKSEKKLYTFKVIL